MKNSGHGKNRGISVAMIENEPHNEPKNDPAHGSAEADQAGDGADSATADKICGEGHYQSGPGLLSEEGHAKDGDGEIHRGAVHQ